MGDARDLRASSVYCGYAFGRAVLTTAAGTPAPGAGTPTPAQVILACLRSSDETLLRLCRCHGIAWPQVVTRARLHRVLPLMMHRLQASGVVQAALVPEDALARLRLERRLLVA